MIMLNLVVSFNPVSGIHKKETSSLYHQKLPAKRFNPVSGIHKKETLIPAKQAAITLSCYNRVTGIHKK